MSRIADKPIALPSDVTVKVENNVVSVSGPLGELKETLHHEVSLDISKESVRVVRNKSTLSKALSGTFRAIISNMVQGVKQQFEKKLELIGVGYRAQVKGSAIDLSLGFSHPVLFEIPKGVSVEVNSNTKISLKSICKRKVGQVAAEIRAIRPPEPYKGKGVKYSDEIIRRKETKKK